MSDLVRPTAETLRGLAHPLRVRLLGLLREYGPATATRLAELTDQSTGATSYHLRQLAAHGFVAEDPTLGVGRERWWRASHGRTELTADEARQAPADAEAYLRAVALLYADRTQRWLAEAPTLPREWDESMTLSDFTLRLTPAEAKQLLDDLRRLIQSYRAEEPDQQHPDGAERVVLQLHVMPYAAHPE